MAAKPTPGEPGSQLVTKQDLNEALGGTAGKARFQGAAAALTVSGIVQGLSHEHSNCASSDLVEISLGENPMPQVPKDEHVLDVAGNGSGSAGVELHHGERESDQDFGLLGQR